jgi:S-formylglutathione hydrolase FrmB
LGRKLGIVLAFVCVLACVGDARAHPPDELDPKQDNPKGCQTATSEDAEQCGAQGRQHFANDQHQPPIKACRGQRSKSGSVVTRVLPKGPVHRDGSLAFVSGVCVYLPPGYGDGKLRYPVMYLLHGGGGDQGNWVTMGGVQSILDAAYVKTSKNAAIVVMPDGRSGQWHDYPDKEFLIETYVLRYVVPYIDSHFRTIADRRGRAIAGLSNGGYGAMHFAAKRPDLFRVAGSMSGNLGARSFGNLGTPVVEGGPTLQEAGAYYYGNTPAPLASNLDGVDLILDWGATCMSDVAVDLCATWAFEQSFRADNQHFRDELEAVGHKGNVDYRETEGSHAWRWWSKWFAERHLPFSLIRLSDPVSVSLKVPSSPVPSSFRYRSIFPSFSVWGYSVSVKRPAPEFLSMTDVRADRMTLTGSGRVTVKTPPRYGAKTLYSVTGKGSKTQVVRADSSGRLTFVVDLGPGHTDDQYSIAGRLAEAQGDYLVTKTVKISRV